MKKITKTVWIICFVSLFTDMASEMLYPVIPIYLQSIGFTFAFIGIIEGIAEAIASLSKGYFGQLSDKISKRAIFVRGGYGISALAKPMMGIIAHPIWILFARTLDRFGKGIRTGARDALLSEEATPQTKGTVFGLHRAMDTLGAIIGPLLAFLYLAYFPDNYKSLFFWAFIPGLIAVSLTFLVKDKINTTYNKKNQQTVSFFTFLKYVKSSSKEYKKLILGLLIFSLFNSSDFFLLLKTKQVAQNDNITIAAYLFYNLIYAMFSLPMGILGDKIGLKKIFLFGLIMFLATYTGMAFATNITTVFVLFFLYGIYAASTEGIAKAWITNLAPKEEAATAIGTFTALQSVCILLASSLTGALWDLFNAQIAFLLTSFMTFIVTIYFIFVNFSESLKT